MDSDQSIHTNSGVEAYIDKPDWYFDSARKDYVEELEDSSSARILELGCGAGPTGALALAAGKCAEYVGIEINPEISKVAEQQITRVLQGNIETMDIPFPDGYFDVLIMSEVLEHLQNPWQVVQKLSKKLRPGGQLMASSPNVSHHRIIRYLLRGEWPLAEAGVMDRTHLRWFTPKTFREMFESAGFNTESVGPISKRKLKYNIVNALSFGALTHLIMVQISYQGRKR